MSNISSGGYRSILKNSFAAFDKLPPTARKALADAAFKWAPKSFLTRWRRGEGGYKTGADIAARIEELDRRTINRDRQRVWGIRDEQSTSSRRSRKKTRQAAKRHASRS